MTRSEVLAELRSMLADTVSPYGWSDDRLMRALALGQTQFCRDTGFFRDSTNYTITTEAGVAAYAVPAEIIEIASIKNGDQEISKALLPSGDFTPGPPFIYSLGEDTGKLTLTPTPDGVYTLKLKVWRSARIPFNHKTGGLYDSEMEIAEEFQFAPIEWAASKLLGDHDSERQDPVKAADHAANYKVLKNEGKRAFRRQHGELPTVTANPIYLV